MAKGKMFFTTSALPDPKILGHIYDGSGREITLGMSVFTFENNLGRYSYEVDELPDAEKYQMNKHVSEGVVISVDEAKRSVVVRWLNGNYEKRYVSLSTGNDGIASTAKLISSDEAAKRYTEMITKVISAAEEKARNCNHLAKMLYTLCNKEVKSKKKSS